MRQRLLTALLLAATACASTHTPVRRTMPTSAREWLDAITAAKAAAAAGRYDEADRTLYNYAQHYAGAPEAREAAYWRALFKLDPVNRSANPRTAVEQLDAYLADSTTELHRTEAVALRRLALSLDSLSQHRIVASAEPVTTEVTAGQDEDSTKAQQREQEMQKEIQRLKEQLERTTAELDRIKKRLAPPTSTPPPPSAVKPD